MWISTDCSLVSVKRKTYQREREFARENDQRHYFIISKTYQREGERYHNLASQFAALYALVFALRAYLLSRSRWSFWRFSCGNDCHHWFH